jgi:peptidoglycan hydrolase-like protein with peptidoglycan-binding domain
MVYARGSRGNVVRQIQARVGAQITGVWDTATARRVATFQEANNLKVTGEVDENTYAILFPQIKSSARAALEDIKQALTPQQSQDDLESAEIKKPTNKKQTT